MSETKTNELQLVVNEAGLAEQRSKELLGSFVGLFQEAKAIVSESKDIAVTQETDTIGMKNARVARLRLREVRIEVENTRKQLKEQSLREGKGIDGMANVIKALIVPVEEYLEKQEKFAELKEAERKQKRYEERVAEMLKYVTDTSIYNLVDMEDETFKALLADTKAAHEARLEKERQAEAERIANEKKEKTYRDRMMELAPFVKFQPRPININTDEREYQEILRLAKAGADKYEMEQEAIRKQNEALQKQAEKDRKAKEDAERKLKEEKEAQEKKEREAREKAEAEKKAKEDAEAKAKAEAEEAERQKLLAPDKQKLLDLADSIGKIPLPAVKSKEAGAVIRAMEEMLGKVQTYILEKAKAL